MTSMNFRTRADINEVHRFIRDSACAGRVGPITDLPSDYEWGTTPSVRQSFQFTWSIPGESVVLSCRIVMDRTLQLPHEFSYSIQSTSLPFGPDSRQTDKDRAIQSEVSQLLERIGNLSQARSSFSGGSPLINPSTGRPFPRPE
jgi:hypothetical protein